MIWWPKESISNLENKEKLLDQEKSDNLWKMIDQIYKTVIKCDYLDPQSPTSSLEQEFKMWDLDVKITWNWLYPESWHSNTNIEITQNGKSIISIQTHYDSSSSNLNRLMMLEVSFDWKYLKYEWNPEIDKESQKYKWYFGPKWSYENIYPHAQRYLDKIQEKVELNNLRNEILQN